MPDTPLLDTLLHDVLHRLGGLSGKVESVRVELSQDIDRQMATLRAEIEVISTRMPAEVDNAVAAHLSQHPPKIPTPHQLPQAQQIGLWAAILALVSGAPAWVRQSLVEFLSRDG